MPGPGPGGSGCGRGREGRPTVSSAHSQPWGAHPGLPLCGKGHPSRLPREHCVLIQSNVAELGSTCCAGAGERDIPKALGGWLDQVKQLPVRLGQMDASALCHPHVHPIDTQAAIGPCGLLRPPDPCTLTQGSCQRLPCGPSVPENSLPVLGKGQRAHHPSAKNQGL